MKTVVMATTISGVHDGEPWPKRGQTADLEDTLADELIAQGHAVLPVDAGQVAEKPLTNK